MTPQAEPGGRDRTSGGRAEPRTGSAGSAPTDRAPTDRAPTDRAPTGRALVVGTGLIGASIGLALRARGWYVTGRDADLARQLRSLRAGALDTVGTDPDADIAFVATPVAAVVPEARRALAELATGVVSDVAGVKKGIVEAVADGRFVGGHPMAGSEQEGLDGADPELFCGAAWVLTPTAMTDPGAYNRVRSVVSSLGAEVLALQPDRHDALVAVVSHVPHLAAATLMHMASEASEEHAAMLRLAAGGFRDMTRIAAGNPEIWPDICADNSEAIVAGLNRLLAVLAKVKEAVASGDRESLLGVLETARAARRSLPVGAPRPEDLVEIRIPVPDRPGVFAEVATVAGSLGVNIVDMEIAHSTEGERGVVTLVVASEVAEGLREALASRSFRPALARLE